MEDNINTIKAQRASRFWSILLKTRKVVFGLTKKPWLGSKLLLSVEKIFRISMETLTYFYYQKPIMGFGVWTAANTWKM